MTRCVGVTACHRVNVTMRNPSLPSLDAAPSADQDKIHCVWRHWPQSFPSLTCRYNTMHSTACPGTSGFDRSRRVEQTLDSLIAWPLPRHAATGLSRDGGPN